MFVVRTVQKASDLEQQSLVTRIFMLAQGRGRQWKTERACCVGNCNYIPTSWCAADMHQELLIVCAKSRRSSVQSRCWVCRKHPPQLLLLSPKCWVSYRGETVSAWTDQSFADNVPSSVDFFKSSFMTLHPFKSYDPLNADLSLCCFSDVCQPCEAKHSGWKRGY